MSDLDATIHARIRELVDEEHRLRAQVAKGEITLEAEHERLDAVQTQLDQLWDLLRQRAARVNAGKNPDEVQARPASTVEGYLN